MLYQNSSGVIGYKVNYLTNWTSYISVDILGNGTPQIGFKAPIAEERLPAYFEIASQFYVKNGTTLDTYIAEVAQDLKQKIPDVTLINSDTSSELAGNPAYSLLYSYVDNETGEVRLERQIGTIIEDNPYHAFYIIYSADVPDYSQYQISIDLLVLPSLEIHINGTNNLSGIENPELLAEQELQLNSGEL